MCGIAGFAGAGSREDLQRMTDALTHRGPDGAGFYSDSHLPVYLGHRRLSIVDVADGHQPMWNEDHTIAVVFNGEIYNHLELRSELQAAGHQFATSHSDTEVLVHGYEEWGQDLPRRLNGMFAFAVFDPRRRRIFLARDRFGEKPLYYSFKNKGLIFASELTALSEHDAVSRTISIRSLQKFFAYGYLPAPHAIYDGVAKLPGGHSLTFDIESSASNLHCYWRFELEPGDGHWAANEDSLIEECADLLARAAERRLMSDVPVGVFLSGGLDSSLVVASLARHLPAGRLKTFTIGFTEPSFDESAFASNVAKYIGTEHYEKRLDLTTARDLIEPLLKRMDEPLGDASILPTYLLGAFTREHVTVALSGDGGDELFAGYDPFLALNPARIYSSIMPNWGHKSLRRLAELLPKSNANMSLDFKIRRSLQGLSYPENIRLPVWMAPLDPKEFADFFEQPLRIEDLYDEAIALWDRKNGAPLISRALEFFTHFYLQDDILMKVDRAAMLNSLESRAVFLDNDLVDFCRKLPNEFKFRNGERKYLLKKVAQRMLPSAIVDRKKKGFGIPLAQWLKKVPENLPAAAIPGVRTGFASRALADHRSGKADHRLFLWSWLATQEFGGGR